MLDVGGETQDNTNIEHLSFLESPTSRPVDQVLTQELSVDQYTNYVLVLCARIFKLNHSIDDDSRPRTNKVTRWRELWEDLNIWESRRPGVLRSILETPMVKNSGSFATILFSTGTALFCNQVYHMSLLLMLRCKPRTLKLTSGPGSSSLMNSTSLVWHAHRICSIAMDNRRPETWDPLLMASLLLAAEYITHRRQQQAVMSLIEETSRLTGWAMETKAAKLRHEWSLADAS